MAWIELGYLFLYAGIIQLVMYFTCNEDVFGSSPNISSKLSFLRKNLDYVGLVCEATSLPSF